MVTTLQKIQDAAGRIDRLGKYVAEVPGGPMVSKAKGVLTLRVGPTHALTMCEPQIGRVWIKAGSADHEVTSEESGLALLLNFEHHLLIKAEEVAREEVIQELVARKLRRVLKPKTRGFKADQSLKRSRAKKSNPA